MKLSPSQLSNQTQEPGPAPASLWELNSPDPAKLALAESLFSQANGYLGVRAYPAEYQVKAYAPGWKSVRGTYLNAFYERLDLDYPETLYGFAAHTERMVSLPDIKYLRLKVNGEDLTPLAGPQKVSGYRQALNPQTGLAEKSYRYQTADGARLNFKLSELVSLVRPEIYAQRLEVQAEAPLDLAIQLGLDASIRNDTGGDDPRLASSKEELLTHTRLRALDQGLLLTSQTPHSQLQLAIAQVMEVEPAGLEGKYKAQDHAASWTYQVGLEAGESLTFTRYTGLCDSRRQAEPAKAAQAAAEAVQDSGWDQLLQEQADFLQDYWQDKRVTIQGDQQSQDALDFMAFHFLQNAAQDGISYMAAKGLTGEGYEGHYFWDFEIFMFPYFLDLWPERAKALLNYRVHTLGQARENAKILGYDRGAQYAWRTITGPECSGYFPSGSAQLHINGDIAKAFADYYQQTGDLDYMAQAGFAVLLETARTWLEVGSWDHGYFKIFGVTGPDEYTCLIDNNYYTNLSAQANLRTCLQVAADLEAAGLKPNLTLPCLSDQFYQVEPLTEEEADRMAHAADHIFLPHNADLGIDAQDETFLSKPVWDFDHTPEDHYPLLLHYHPSKLYRYQVLKQADTCLAHFLFAPELDTPTVQKSRRYYEAITTHDSSLSGCIYGALAAYAGESKKAWDYFVQARDLDLKNVQGNTVDGLHLGSLGGIWLFLLRGFAGLRLTDQRLSLRPHLPASWQELSLPYHYQGGRLDLKLGHLTAEMTWSGQHNLDLAYRGRQLKLQPGKPQKVQAILGIVFDLDGVLVHTDRFHREAWQRLAQEEGLYFDPSLGDALRGVSRMASLDLLLEKAGAAERYSHEEKLALADRKNNYYRNFLQELTPEDFAPQHREALKDLRAAGYKLGISSSSKNARFILDRLGLTDYFDAITGGEDIQHSKPHPEVFLQTAAKFGLDPRDLMVVEDAESGLEAAQAGHFIPAGFGAAKDSDLAAYSFKDLTDFFAFFKA